MFHTLRDKMPFIAKALSEEPVEVALEAMLLDISRTSSVGDALCVENFDLRHHQWKTEARNLSLMIKAETDLDQRNLKKSTAAQKNSYIDYANLPPLTPEGLAGLEKRFAHLAYETEIGRRVPTLPRPT